MKTKFWLYLFLICGLTLGLSAVPEKSSADDVVIIHQNPALTDVKEAFFALTSHGEWLGFHPGHAPYQSEICTCTEVEEIPGLPISIPIDGCMPTCPPEMLIPDFCCTTREQHFQGIARANRVGGSPIIYVTRAGKLGNYFSEYDSHGALWVVEMASRDQTGERLRSNRLEFDTETRATSPPSNDKVVTLVEFSPNLVDENGVLGNVDYHHPGGMQVLGDILVIALEEPNVDACTTAEFDTPAGCLPKGKIGFFDISDPLNPMYIGDFGLKFHDHGAGAVGITRLPGGTYMVVVYPGRSNTPLKFFESTGTDFWDESFEFVEHTFFTYDELKEMEEGGRWFFNPEPQSLNFVNEIDENGFERLYLIGSRNNAETSPLVNGYDMMYLWKVEGYHTKGLVRLVGDLGDPGPDNDVPNGPAYEAHKYLSSQGDLVDGLGCNLIWQNNLRLQEANFGAGGGAYITPQGELLYYGVSYWNLGTGNITRMAELRPKKVTSSGECGPQLEPDHLGGPYTIPEMSLITINGEAVMIEPWVQMYADTNFSRSSVMLDWDDRAKDDYGDFKHLDGHRENFLNSYFFVDDCHSFDEGSAGHGYHGFDDCMSSFRFCGPVGSQVHILDDDADDGWGEAYEGDHGWVKCTGTGSTVSVAGFDDGTDYTQPPECTHHGDKDWKDFNDEATAAQFVWAPDGSESEPYTWDALPGTGTITPDTALENKQADYKANRGTYLETVQLSVWGETVEAEIFVENVPPSIDDFTIDSDVAEEGELVVVTVEWSDPGADSVNWEIDWGDGSIPDTGTSSSTNISGPFDAVFYENHVYADDAAYDITVRIDDTDENGITDETKGIVINNVPPHAVYAGADQVLYEGDVFSLDPAEFSDRGTLDTHTATVDWGDSSSIEFGAVTEFPFGPPGSTAGADGTVDATHQYSVPPGIYTVTLCVKDDELAETCDDLNVTVVHGFMRFCAYADDEHHGITLHKDVVAACRFSPAGVPGEMRDSGVGSRGDVDINEGTAVKAILLSLDGKINVGQKVTVSGTVTAGDDVTAVKGSLIDSHITAGQRVDIKKNATVNGDITAAGRIKVDRRATVNGATIPYTPVPPIPAITWVEFAVDEGTENVTLRKGAAWTLEPDDYRDLKVGSGATLTLQAGHYAFQRITVEKGATLNFDLTAAPGTIVVDVADKLLIKQDVQMVVGLDNGGLPTSEAQDILFRVANISKGRDSVQLHAGGSYLGTFLAPNSNVQLGDGAVLEGALYGRKVKIEKEATISGKPALDLFIDTFVNP